MRMVLRLLLAVFAMNALASGAVLASGGGGDLRLEPAPIHPLDNESLQRGARTFVNYCLNCHSAKYMRYNRLTDIGLTEAQIRDNLMLATDKIGDTMTVAMSRDSKSWFGTTPPDLSVEARVRGTEWLYNYFLTFYRDDSTPTGWNNLVYPNVAMPHVLWKLSGVNRLEVQEFEDHEKAQAAALATRATVMLAPGHNNKVEVRSLVTDTPGTLKPEEYRVFVADLVNYLDYMAEPAKTKRINIGLVVLMFLSVLFLFAYWAKREYWKDVH
ncbi:MAG: cytochrome c1 [Pseudomonadota bacterium]|nr:cytochrome c1 [Pseudomonadota bacterium]